MATPPSKGKAQPSASTRRSLRSSSSSTAASRPAPPPTKRRASTSIDFSILPHEIWLLILCALESLENVQHVKVRRCDEMGGLGGAGGWLGGCAHADRGALSWLLTFEAPGANRALDARASVAEVRTRAS